MDTLKGASKPDWHPADVKAALEKRGISLRALARQYGYSHIQRVLTGPWWAAEQIVAKALGLAAQDIWPSRYTSPRSRAEGMTRNQVALKAVTKAAAKTPRARKATPTRRAA